LRKSTRDAGEHKTGRPFSESIADRMAG
jgi:hypothetical protein